MMRVRPAEPDDAPTIVRILREGFPPSLIDDTIYGCHGIEAYVSDSIRCQAVANGVWYVLVHEDSGVRGFAEIRRSLDDLFFNHLFVTPGERGPGVGTSLMFHALKAARGGGQRHVEFDVFADNVSVLRGHRALGFTETYQQLWVEISLADQAAGAERSWFAAGLAQADRIHRSYGFSEFGLETSAANYRVGRLGDHLFRVTQSEAIADPCFLSALKELDPARNLLSIGKADPLRRVLPGRAVEKARSIRLGSEVDEVLRRLSDFLAF